MIHQYKLNGYNIVLDVFSGSIHIPDDAAYDAIRLIDEGRTKEEAETILAETYRDRGITAEDIWATARMTFCGSIKKLIRSSRGFLIPRFRWNR